MDLINALRELLSKWNDELREATKHNRLRSMDGARDGFTDTRQLEQCIADLRATLYG